MTSKDLSRYEQPRAEEPEVADIHASIQREKMEPKDGFQPVPMTLLLAAFALLMWGGWYLGEYDAEFAVDRFDGPQAYAPVAVATEPKEPKKVDPMAVGKRVYVQCAACHQQNGMGVTGAFPPLAASEWVTGSKAQLARILLGGMQGPVEVKGQVYNGVMPAWPQLSNEEIAYVLTYIRNSWGNDASAIEPEYIGEVREATKGKSGAWTAEALSALEGDDG